MTGQRRLPELQRVILREDYTVENLLQEELGKSAQLWMYERSLRREIRQNLYNFKI